MTNKYNCKLYYQQLQLKYLCKLVRYWFQALWGWHCSVETCRGVIICEVIVRLLVILQNSKRCFVHVLKYKHDQLCVYCAVRTENRGQGSWSIVYILQHCRSSGQAAEVRVRAYGTWPSVAVRNTVPDPPWHYDKHTVPDPMWHTTYSTWPCAGPLNNAASLRLTLAISQPVPYPCGRHQPEQHATLHPDYLVHKDRPVFGPRPSTPSFPQP